MSEFTIYRNKNFASIPTYHLKDQKLSLKAVGLLTKMLLLPPEWDYSLSGLATLNKDGIDSVRSTLNELKYRNYIEIEKLHSEKGTWKYNYIVFEKPADKVIIPVQSEFLAAKGMNHLMNTILKVKKNINPKLDVAGIVLTIVDGRRNLSKEISEELKESYGKVFKLYDTQIPRAVKAAESSRMGESILSYDKDSNVAKSYIELAKEVLDDERIRNKARNSNELQSR